MARTANQDPYANFNFLVEIGGVTMAWFQEVSGLDSSIDIIEIGEGGNITPLKQPGRVKYSNLQLKRGMTDDLALYEWHRKWVTGDPTADRRDGSIVLLDRQKAEKVRWNFTNGWPAKWTGPSLNAEGNDLAIESLEIAHEGLVRVK